MFLAFYQFTVHTLMRSKMLAASAYSPAITTQMTTDARPSTNVRNIFDQWQYFQGILNAKVNLPWCTISKDHMLLQIQENGNSSCTLRTVCCTSPVLMVPATTMSLYRSLHLDRQWRLFSETTVRTNHLVVRWLVKLWSAA